MSRGLPTDSSQTLADLMVESGLAEGEGNALKNKHGLRPISAVQQTAEWERVTKNDRSGRPRLVWLPPCHSPLPSAGDVTSPPPTVSAVRA